MSLQAILMAGPTASGKSSLAIRIAQALGGTIINADSMQVYRDIDIISAMPTAYEQAIVPHKIYGVVPFGHHFSVANWLSLAQEAFAETLAAGRLPIFVGGTGMYFTALLKGLADIPEPDEKIRQEIRTLHKSKGATFLHNVLAEIDPKMASRLKPNDGQRIARALEVMRSTGRSLADWQEETVPGLLGDAFHAGQIQAFVLHRPREELYDHINARLLKMVAMGAIDEVKALMKNYPGVDASSIKALGIPSFRAFIKSEISKEAAIEDAQKQTRRYAKRQMTWFNNQFADWQRINMSDEDKIQALIERMKQEI